MNEACTRIFASNSVSDLLYPCMGRDLRDEVLTPYSDDGNGEGWDFADVPVGCQVDGFQIFAGTWTQFTSCAVCPVLPYLLMLEAFLAWLYKT